MCAATERKSSIFPLSLEVLDTFVDEMEMEVVCDVCVREMVIVVYLASQREKSGLLYHARFPHGEVTYVGILRSKYLHQNQSTNLY